MKARAIAKATQERGVYKLLKQYSVISCKTYRVWCSDCQIALEARKNWGKRFHILSREMNKWDELESEAETWMQFIAGDDTIYDEVPDLWKKTTVWYNEQMGTCLTTPTEILAHYRSTRKERQQ